MSDNPDRRSIIEAVQTPLGFFTLVVLVVETALCVLATALSGDDRTFLVRAIPYTLAGVTIVVAVIAWFRPEALWGKRFMSTETTFAESLGVEIFDALDGYLSNLEASGRAEAYAFLYETVVTSPSGTNPETRDFCKALVGAVKRRAQVKARYKEGILRVAP